MQEKEMAIGKTATFEQMGLRVEKSIAKHLLLENAYENNLLPDISTVDYLQGHLGDTELQPLDGLPIFVDDIYVFGYLHKRDVVSIGRKMILSTGEKGRAKELVCRLRACLLPTIGDVHAAVVQTVRMESVGTVSSTIQKIEKRTNKKVLDIWRKIHETEPVGYCVAKIAVSEIDVDILHEQLPEFFRMAEGLGFGIYCIDYTQDCSGTLDKKRLVSHLVENKGMVVEGSNTHSDKGTILDNTSTVGNNVCTYRSTSQGNTIRTKIYNKVVSNFEAGTVHENYGGHLADYVDSTHERLRETFHHLDVQARGCTRVEISIYAIKTADVQTGKDLLQEALETILGGGFVVQPPRKQWTNLAAKLDRSCIVADKPSRKIYPAWYAHTTTKRTSGIVLSPTLKADWEKCVLWAIAEFGFRASPIYRIDILEEKEDGVQIGDLRCYCKQKDSGTILANCRTPVAVHLGPNPKDLLPETDVVSWEFRTTKSSAIGKEKNRWPIEEVSTDRTISTLSTTKRTTHLLSIANAEERDRLLGDLEKRHKEIAKIREKEVAQIVEIGEKYANYKKRAIERKQICKPKDTQHLLEPETYLEIVGYTTHKPMLVYGGDGKCYKTNRKLAAIVESQKEYFDVHNVLDAKHCLLVRIGKWSTFQTLFGESVDYLPVYPVLLPDKQDSDLLDKAIEKEIDVQTGKMYSTICPKQKDTMRVVDLEVGNYIAYRYTQTKIRTAKRTILFVQAADANWVQTDGVDIPIVGYFLQKEIEKLGDLEQRNSPILCIVGEYRTTSTNKKDRVVFLSTPTTNKVDGTRDIIPQTTPDKPCTRTREKRFVLPEDPKELRKVVDIFVSRQKFDAIGKALWRDRRKIALPRRVREELEEVHRLYEKDRKEQAMQKTN
jgi:hypothetical protein